METNQIINSTEEKIIFLKNDFIAYLQKLNADDKGEWGVMNAQQMVEHLCNAFRNWHGMESKKIITPAQHLSKYKEFLLSDRPFKPGTKNPEMPETALTLKQPNMKSAIEDLRTEISIFFNYFENNKEKTITNPYFGELNFDENIRLLHKHVMHHLKQFRLIN